MGMYFDHLIRALMLHIFTIQGREEVDRVFSVPNRPNKEVVFNVKVLAPSSYSTSYQSMHRSLPADLQKITEEVVEKLNASVRLKANGFTIRINLDHPTNHSLMGRLNQSLCEGSVAGITNLLGEVNNVDPGSHFIVLLPCSSMMFANIFESVGADVPLIQHSINVQCTQRVAIFLETRYQTLMSAFGNALLKTVGFSPEDYA